MASSHKDNSPLLPKLQKLLKTITFRSPADYVHHEWAKAVQLGTPNRVLSKFTLKELTDAMNSGEKVEVSYISNYYARIATRDWWPYNSGEEQPSKEEQNQFLIPNEDGSNSAIFEIGESVQTSKQKVVALVLREPPQYYGNKKADAGEYWTATFSEDHFSERNYNAGWDEWQTHLTVHCDGEVFTWGPRPK